MTLYLFISKNGAKWSLFPIKAVEPISARITLLVLLSKTEDSLTVKSLPEILADFTLILSWLKTEITSKSEER
jgi:hypothetical protein